MGIALLCAGLFFDMSAVSAQNPMPTPDRLAQPTLPAQPSQADKGAQVYWLSCLPCHGDRGQGLTDEFRETYPEEEQYCWAAGCHGNNPYESGFTIPRIIPAVIGAGALQKFPNALALRSYIFSAMPFWKPGSLSGEEAWQVTAFLLRENLLWDSKEELTEANAALVRVALSPASPPPSQPRTASRDALFLLIAVTVSFVVLYFVLRHFTSKGESKS